MICGYATCPLSNRIGPTSRALPYNHMFGPETWLPPVRAEAERETTHPVFHEYMQTRVGKNFSRDEARNAVLPAYMGLIKKIDDQMGVLFDLLKERDLWKTTMIVFTSDHGDYLGDHWLGDKDFFHDPAARVPLIIRDPRQGAVRGQIHDAMVEAIGLAPTFLGCFDGAPVPSQLAGRALTPLLAGKLPDNWRQVAFSEYDYSARRFCELLGGPQAMPS